MHIATGRALSGILEDATREGSDLIVIGTNGRSGLARAVLGSVTESVVRQATMPVLTIPPSAEGKATGKPVAGESVRPRSCRGHDLQAIRLVAQGLPGPDDPRDPGRNLLSIREVCRGRRAS